jgi:IS30 family transposase
MQNTTQKHLTLEDRNYIEQALNQNMTFKEIGKFLSKDPTTISKEIKKHRIRKEQNTFNNYSANVCTKRYNCSKKNVCGRHCNIFCNKCIRCNQYCNEFDEQVCPSLKQAPYVCNSCKSKTSCRLVKYYYRALPSYNQYKHILSTSRQGINLSNEELCELDNIVSPLIKQGQTISHIYKNNSLNCSISSLYNYIDKNQLSARNIDLPRRVRYSKRKSTRPSSKDTTIRKGRTYEDFEKYLLDNPDTSIVEMDTVEGKKGGKVLLTMLFRSSKFMLAFLLKDKTTNSVLKVFNWLENILGNDLFEKTFPVIITDNGSEFSNPLSLEFNEEGIGRTRIFFCNPGASYQKGAIEKNHEFIRYVIPKGTSMDIFTQNDITKLINHINSLTRPSLNNATPYDLAQILLDRNVLKKLNLIKVPANEIQLNKNLLKKN